MHFDTKKYIFPLLLFVAVSAGAMFGAFFPSFAPHLKPIATIFINYLLVAVIPYIFFSIIDAVVNLFEENKFWLIFKNMIFVFTATGIVAATFMLAVLNYFPPLHFEAISLNPYSKSQQLGRTNFLDSIAPTLSVPDLSQLFSSQHLLPLIIFAVFVGIAIASLGKEAQVVRRIIKSSSMVFARVIQLIMNFAPLGFFAFFAVLSADLGRSFLTNYLWIGLIYYFAAIFYFVVFYSLYAYIANGRNGFINFWQNVFYPLISSLATCSSVASIPANITTCHKIGVHPTVGETVIPFGAILHKEGSVMGGVLKIIFLLAVLHIPLQGLSMYASVIIVSLLVGVVMGAIPSGGMLGEIFIISVFGLPAETLMLIVTISLIIDPIATALNVTGDIPSAMIVQRLTVSNVQVEMVNDTEGC